MEHMFGVVSKKYLPNSKSQRLSSKCFIVSDFTLKFSLSSFLQKIKDVDKGSFFTFFAYGYPIVPVPVEYQTLLSQQN